VSEVKQHDYNEDNIRSLDWREHIRLRPGMYIGKLGDGSSPDDGIYVLLKEIVDNTIDEYVMGFGKQVDIDITDLTVTIRDYGRGIPLGKVIECVSKINTGGKYDSRAFQRSVGLNGVGTKAVNALSLDFAVSSYREGQVKTAIFRQGELVEDLPLRPTTEPNGTRVVFTPDESVFRHFRFYAEYIEEQIWNYAYLNAGLTIQFNKQKYFSRNGLMDLLSKKTKSDELRYPIIHFRDEMIEFALSHGNSYGEEYYSYVNGQYTTQGGTHLSAFREAIVKTIREFYKKNFEASDIRASIISAISVRVQDPIFESQTKTKLGSVSMGPNQPSVKLFIQDYLKEKLDAYLYKNPNVAEALLKRIQQSERERKDMAGVRKIANQRAKTANLHNKKLRDCRYHYTDEKNPKSADTMLFITEGDSASGSITKARDPETQAVFSLRGKPMNVYKETKKVVYQNEEFNLLQHALDIEEDIENLRYKKIIIATDADVDGMHIRMLLLTFFLQFFPEVVRKGHLFILETPLFRVRNKQETIYCYSESEKQAAIRNLKGKPEITRFKGLGEISPNEFGQFIGPDIRLEPVVLQNDKTIDNILEYYMGKNTPERQNFIIDNLRFEIDEVKEDASAVVVEALSEV
jgi:topoisomerase IV subunit B